VVDEIGGYSLCSLRECSKARGRHDASEHHVVRSEMASVLHILGFGVLRMG
jgi:hypothetical protein